MARAMRMLGAAGLSLIAAGCGASTQHPAAKPRSAKGSDPPKSAHTTPATTASLAVTPRVDVPSCLARAGLNDVTETSSGRWQGVVGGHSRGDETASVFVVGPYSSSAAVRHAVPTAGKGEVAAAGGLYLLVGSAAGHVAAPLASAAACLRPTADSVSKPKHSKGYTF